MALHRLRGWGEATFATLGHCIVGDATAWTGCALPWQRYEMRRKGTAQSAPHCGGKAANCTALEQPTIATEMRCEESKAKAQGCSAPYCEGIAWYGYGTALSSEGTEQTAKRSEGKAQTRSAKAQKCRAGALMRYAGAMT